MNFFLLAAMIISPFGMHSEFEGVKAKPKTSTSKPKATPTPTPQPATAEERTMSCAANVVNVTGMPVEIAVQICGCAVNDLVSKHTLQEIDSAIAKGDKEMEKSIDASFDKCINSLSE